MLWTIDGIEAHDRAQSSIASMNAKRLSGNGLQAGSHSTATGVRPGDAATIQQRLADAIYEHRLPPGTKLVEADLCRIFSVTRGMVRKVLGRLAAEQLIDLFPNRGAFVARPTVDETRDVFELRRILEAGIVRRLAETSRHAWIDRVRQQIADEREAKRLGDTPRYIRLAGQFHLDLAAATGNAALEQHLKRLVAQTSLMLALYDVPGINACSFHEHLEILDAIEAGDYARAERLMDDHLLGCERQLRLDEEPRRIDLARALGAPAARPASRRAGVRTKPAQA
jgi:DNA-binding GntR family transcriptional regulator